MADPEVGKQYTLFIPGEPVPKSTMKPPNVKSSGARDAIIHRYDRYAPLANTIDYQRLVADFFRYHAEIPRFDKDDPIAIGFEFRKGKHATGDLKNLVASVEDGLTYSDKIYDDGQIVSRLPSRTEYYCDEPGVLVTIAIDERVLDSDRLFSWLRRQKKRMKLYQELRGL